MELIIHQIGHIRNMQIADKCNHPSSHSLGASAQCVNAAQSPPIQLKRQVVIDHDHLPAFGTVLPDQIGVPAML